MGMTAHPRHKPDVNIYIGNYLINNEELSPPLLPVYTICHEIGHYLGLQHSSSESLIYENKPLQGTNDPRLYLMYPELARNPQATTNDPLTYYIFGKKFYDFQIISARQYCISILYEVIYL
mgnify:CR=1 FL=1